ncbi:MAG: efflux RND transporter periplasmic adaptor subunit [Burkholderiaceae bacterium]|nr:efflux RND transporter periplasmic adaptor subunit [Burkholderiaceae bacterium]
MRRAARGALNALVLIVILGVAGWWFHVREPQERDDTIAGPAPASQAAAPRPVMTVTTATPKVLDWKTRLEADGSVAAWQEVSISPEVGGFRIAEVLVNVGDRVRAGQPLATLAPTSVANDVAQQTAALAEARAALAEAAANAQRARKLRDSGALSAQQVTQYLTAEQTAQARVGAAQARLDAEKLRMSQTRVLAPDDGVISQRSAMPGAMAAAGEELFRLIREARLEWRAEVPGARLHLVHRGQPVTLALPDGSTVPGTVRIVAPTIDPRTRLGLAYVDIGELGSALRAGLYARGSFELGSSPALTVPAASVLLRDGFSYVFTLGEDSRVRLVKVKTGRREGDRIEITEGLAAEETVVDSGVGFLVDGDPVAVSQSMK